MAKKLDKVDVVICGTGWAGGISAAELTKEGYEVVALERGKEQSLEDFVGSKDELRYNRRFDLMQDLTQETITSRNKLDEKAKPVRNNADLVLGTGNGGTAIHWHGVTYRWWPYDFEIYSKTVDQYGKDKIPDNVPLQDWGITYDEMKEYYDKFEKTAGTSGDSEQGPKRSDDLPNPPLKQSKQLKLFEKAAKELEYNPLMSPAGNISEQYDNPDGETINACVYCAFCNEYGCDFGAKSDPLATVLKTAEKTDKFEVRNESYVTRVLHDGDKATGLKYINTKTGEEYEQPADLVVLGGFAFTNNKLLLLSEIGEPYDPESGEGIIGKNLAGHDYNLDFIGPTGFFDDNKFNNFAGAGALGMVVDDFNGENLDTEDHNFIHGFSIGCSTVGQRPIEVNPVPEGTPMWGEEFKEKSLYYTNRNIGIKFQKGTMPHEHNYYSLDPNYKDTFGDPLLRVTRDYTEQDKNLSKYAIKKSEEVLEKMGADIVDSPEVPDHFPHSYQTAHFGGGVIMGDNPETSAVNSYLQMWDMENLFVVGGSAFPHFSCYNPTGTIGAISYRAAEGMKKYLDNDGGILVGSEED